MCKNHKRGVVKCAGKEGRGKGGSLVTKLPIVIFKESGFPLGTSLCFMHFHPSSLYYLCGAVRE